jgi:deazaflavin-dependent oxidoreductase (nitroreductase family)
MTVRAMTEGTLSVGLPASAPGLVRRVGALHGSLYALSGGRWLSRWFGLPVMILETVGRRSGRCRRAPVCYLPDGNNRIVVPANGGADRVPAWWLNLSTAGEGIAIVGGRRDRVRPVVARAAERERLWKRFAAAYPSLDGYRERARRELAVVVLEPVAY